MIRSPSPCRVVAPFALLAALASSVASAADIYVVEARISRDGVTALAPTFIVTRGDRALLAFDGERDLDVAMTILPPSAGGAASGDETSGDEASGEVASGDEASGEGASEAPAAGRLELRIELVDADSRHDEIVDVSLYRPTTVRLGERELEISVREQEGTGG